MSAGGVRTTVSCSEWASQQKGAYSMQLPSLKCRSVALAALALLGLGGPAARADFLPAFSGNSQMSDAVTSSTQGVRGVVSFSVFANNSPDFVTAINTALGLSS